MRSTAVTMTLLSLGALTTQTALAADPRVVLDTVTANQADKIPQFCDGQGSFGIEHCSPNICVAEIAFAPQGGLGMLVHADATMTITRIGNWFAPRGTSVTTGPGFFAITDVATREQIWSARAIWTDVSSPSHTASIELGTASPVTLHRGRDYVISYAAASYLGLPRADEPPPLCSRYGSVEQPMSGLLVPKGYVRVSLDGARSSEAKHPVWTFSTAAIVPSPIPSFSVTAIIGDSDEDGFTDDVDNCVDLENANQADFDHDRVGDACDNCPYTYNPQQGSCSAGGGGGGGGLDDDGTDELPDGPADMNGCNAGAANVSLLVMLAALMVRRRRRSH